MKIFTLLLTFGLLFSGSAFANILDKVQIEDILQRRIEHNLTPYDEKVRARVKFIYKSPSPLPGTTLIENEALTPNVISENDIRGLQVDIQSRLSSLTPEMQNEIYSAIPLKKNRIKIKFETIKDVSTPPPAPLVAKDFWDISQNFWKNLSQGTLSLLGVLCAFISVLSFVLHRSKVKNAKDNFERLIQSIRETSGPGAGTEAPLKFQTMSQKAVTEALAETPVTGRFSALPPESLKEFFADCYWTEQDRYAHWMWQSLTTEQKKSALEVWPQLKKYSAYFIHLPVTSQNDHLHPYYLAPENLAAVSQDTLEKEVKKNPDIWLKLSPLRQRHLNLPIAEKIRVVKKGDAAALPPLPTATQQRSLPLTKALGTLSFADEMSLVKKPDLIPQEMKAQFQTLVWLSLKPAEQIEQTLAQFDAYSLATAWVGAPEVLEKLETHLPEKKRKMLKSYLEKVSPSQHSDVYLALCEAGMKQNAA